MELPIKTNLKNMILTSCPKLSGFTDMYGLAISDSNSSFSITPPRVLYENILILELVNKKLKISCFDLCASLGLIITPPPFCIYIYIYTKILWYNYTTSYTY